MGKRTTSSSSRGKGSKRSGGKSSKGTSKKGAAKSSALAYAKKIEQLDKDRKNLEKKVRKDIDGISEDIGQFVSFDIDVGKAPQHLEKARASADKKDYKTAREHLNRAETAIGKSAGPNVEERINEAQSKINAVERLGVDEADLGEQLGDARNRLKKKKFLPALEIAENAAKRAVELAQNQLTEVVSISEMLIKDAEAEGLDVSKAQESLEQAQEAVVKGDYEAAVEHTLQVQTGLERARMGLTSDADGESMSIGDMVGEEDREYVADIVRRGLEALDNDLGTLEEIRGLVSHPENLASKARKALEDGNLGPARKLLRDAHLATIRALRERLQDVSNAAAERMKKAKRDGLNLQEIRSIHSQAILAVDNYKFKDAYDLALSIEERINKVQSEKDDIEESILEAKEEMAILSDLGTNEARVQELIDQAQRNMERGDFKKARLNIAKGVSTGKTSTQNFINNYIVEVRNVLLSVRTIGGNIATARPMLITAKKEMNKKDFAKAVELVNDSLQTIKGVDQEYLATLKELMKTKYNYTLAESLGLNVTETSEHLESAFQELKNKNYTKAVKLSQKTDFEVEIITEDFKTTSEDLASAKESISEAKKVGADVAEADFLLSKAITQIEKNSFEVAQELLTDAHDAAEKARSDRVGALLEESKAVIEEEEKKDVLADSGKQLLMDAEKAYKRADHSSTIELINEAIKVMSENSRRMEFAQDELNRAEELMEETGRYAEANPLAEDFISTSRNLLAGGQYPEAYDVANQAIVDLEASLVRYIDLIMEDTKNEISKAEEAGAQVPKARDSYKLARRYLDKQDAATALNLARKASNMAKETLLIYQEVMENLDLLDSYIQWGKRVSRHLRMPVSELEEANSLVKEKKFGEAQSLVIKALDTAKEAQVTFVNDDLESVDVFLRELESGGVGTSVARNTLNQAHNSLDEMNFEQAYTLASQAREQGLKNQELYGEIIKKLQKGNERLNLADSLGVDIRTLQELVDKTEKALINQTYTFALDFVDQLLNELPKVTQVYINRRFNDMNKLLEDATSIGLLVEDQEKLMAKAKDVASQGLLEETVETLTLLETELQAIRERYDDAKGALNHLAEILGAAEDIGVEVTGPRDLEAEAAKQLVANDFKAVHRIVSDAEDELIRTSSSFIVEYIKGVQTTLMRLERSGAYVMPVEKQVDEAWSQLESRRFTEAFSTARESTLSLQRVEERFHAIHDRLQATETDVIRMGFLEVDTGDASDVIVKAHDALTDLDFDQAEKHIGEALDELAAAIKDVVETQITELEGLITSVDEEGADVSSAKERLDRAQSLIEMGQHQAGYMIILDGVEAVQRARREMDDAVEGRRRAEHLFKDTEELGADVTRAKEQLAEVDDNLSAKRYRDALNAVRRLALETEKAKHDHVLGLLAEGANALIEAEELGLSVKVLRSEMEEAENQLDARDFHAAVATSEEATSTARELISKFVTARDRIVEIQAFIYDANGIGTNTGSATDLLGEARDAMAEQRLDEALDLTQRSETEVIERQEEMVSYELETLLDLREDAEEEGMVLSSIDNSIESANELNEAKDHKAAILRLREGIEEGRGLLVKFQVAQETIGRAEGLVTIMNELGIDSGVPTAELDKGKRLIPDEEYDTAKEVANGLIGDVTRALEDHITEMVDNLNGNFTRAGEIGIKVADIERSFNEAQPQVDPAEFLAMASLIDEHVAQVKERTSAYDDALSRIEEAQTLFTDAEDLQVDISTALPTLDGAREALAGGSYADAASRADTAREEVLELQRQFVNKYIKDAEDLIAELQNMGVDTVQANEFLDQAKAGLDLEEYPSAHSAALQAITESQRVKDLFNEASNLIEEAKKTIERAKSLGIDPSPAIEPLEQAVDSLEFQSYEESRDFAIDSRQVAGRLMQEHVEDSLEQLRKDAEGLLADGVEFAKGIQLVDLASTNLSDERFIEAQDTIDVAMVHLEKRRALHTRSETIHRTVFEELENAETLGVDVGIYESDLQRFREFYDVKDYVQAIPWGISLLERLGKDERAMMDIYIGEVTDLFDEFMDGQGLPKQPMEALNKSLDYFYDGDYIRSYNFAIRARESIETESRSMDEGKDLMVDCRNTIVWADGMGVPLDEAKAELDRGMQFMDASEYTKSLEAVKVAQEQAMKAVAEVARNTIDTAEARAEEVYSGGANSETVSDRVKRGQRSLETDDYGYALMFAQLALTAARKAEVDLVEAKKASEEVMDELELARRILSDPSEVEAFGETIKEALERRLIGEAIKQSKLALTTIRTKMHGASQNQIDQIQDDIRLMELMDLDGSAMSERLEDARSELETGNYVACAEIVEDIRDPVRTMMEDRARSSLDEAKEAVEAMRTVGADDAEVVQGLNETQDMFAAQDFYHSNEASARTTKRANLVSDNAIGKVIDDLRRLLEEALRLGVETGELEKRVEKADRHRSKGRFVDAKGTLDDLAKDVDEAQRELVEGIVKTCDELSIITNERELDARDGPALLQEAHHHLSLKSYKPALEAARSSFDNFEELFTVLVRKTLQEAKDLLVNLDVSADIETSSDHYIEAEEYLDRKDYVAALANADAAMANARVIQVQIIEEILTEVDLENERGDRIGAEMETSLDMAVRSREELADGKLEDAQTLAFDARQEARTLQQAHSSSLLQATRARVDAVPFEVELDDVRELLESSNVNLETGDFEAAADAAIQADTILKDRLQGEVGQYIDKAEEDLERGKEVGIDLTGPSEHLKDAKGHLDEGRYMEGQEAAQLCSDLVAELIEKHQEAAEALNELMELIERATRARAKLSESMDMQEAAEDAMDEYDYDRVVELVGLAIQDANRSYEIRVNEAISTADSNLNTLERMGANAKLADDLLGEARGALEADDLDGAYDYADQSIKEADQAKTSFRDIIDITFQAESLIGTAKGFGMEVEEAQAKFEEALATRPEDVNRALSLAEEAKAIATALVDSFFPEIDVAMEVESALVLDKWTNANLMVRNDGSARALRTTLELTGNLDVDGLGQINILRGNGKVKKLPIRLKPLKSGEIMVRVWIRCEREYDDKPYEFHDVRWLMADEEEPEEEEEEPGAQFLRKELTCTICQGKIGTQEAPRACSCGATFHQECSEQLVDCPNCGKSLGGA
jgi:tetratricopeptide (TPR) repeat protein